MRDATPTQPELESLPLWRLLVELDDAERSFGADSTTVRVLARLVQERLRGQRQTPAGVKEVPRATS